MIHSTSVFRRSFLYLCILGAFGLTSCTSCKQKNAGSLGPKVDPGPPGADGKQGADENKESDREAKEEEIKLELDFNDLTSATAQGSPSTNCFELTLKNNGSKTIQLAKLKLGYKTDLVCTYQGGHETGDVHQDQFIIVQADSRNDVHDMTLEALTGQAELAVGDSVPIKTVVKTGEAVDAATTQLKVMEVNETRASQAFNFDKQQTPAKDKCKLPEGLTSTSDVHEDKENIAPTNSSDTSKVTPGESSSQAELVNRPGESVTTKTAVQTGGAVGSTLEETGDEDIDPASYKTDEEEEGLHSEDTLDEEEYPHRENTSPRAQEQKGQTAKINSLTGLPDLPHSSDSSEFGSEEYHDSLPYEEESDPRNTPTL